MARITVEDCLEKVQNRFALILLASKRTKQLLTGSKLTIEDKRENKAVVNSLREISEGTVRFKTEEDLQREREIALKKREAELALAAEAENASNGAPTGPDSIFVDDSDSSSSDSSDSDSGDAVGEESSEPASTDASASEGSTEDKEGGDEEASGTEQTLLVS